MIVGDSGEAIDCIHCLRRSFVEQIDSTGRYRSAFNQFFEALSVGSLQCCDELNSVGQFVQPLVNGHGLVYMLQLRSCSAD